MVLWISVASHAELTPQRLFIPQFTAELKPVQKWEKFMQSHANSLCSNVQLILVVRYLLSTCTHLIVN